MEDRITYEVNIDSANDAKKEMASILETDNSRVLNKVGAFASLYEFDFTKYEHPVLVSKTEEPGSKQLLAVQYGSIESVAYDMINHLINDCIVMGATPLIVQDAIICGRLDKVEINKIVKAAADACKKEGCILTGGETSEQPRSIPDGEYVLTSSITGVVEKSKIIDGSKIEEGDVVIGVASSGVHTNGYTMVRTIIDKYPEVVNEKVGDKTFIEAVLVPHMCYYSKIKDLFDTGMVRGMAHITGGGIKENLNRILPDNLNAEIDLSKYDVLDVFKVIRKYGNVSDAEMIRTFNLGVGLAMVVPEQYVEEVKTHIKNNGVNCYEIGRIVKGEKKVTTIGEINW